MTYGELLKQLIDSSRFSKTYICESLGISRPYLYAVFSGATPPPVPEKQIQLVELLNSTEDQRSLLFDLAAQERNEPPADIAQCIKDPSFLEQIRKEYIYPTERSNSEMSGRNTSRTLLRVPCCYQGGKQRVSKELVDQIFGQCRINDETRFYDLCCGSGAFTVELLNRGVKPENITMLDKSSWGMFWKEIGSGTFDLAAFEKMLDEIPSNKKEVKSFVSQLALKPVGEDESHVYLLLQACSFGGKQIWNDGSTWQNAFFRDYWEPKANSVRKSPANPMQPSPQTLLSRVRSLAQAAKGITCIHDDVNWVLEQDIPSNSIAYVDPPYRNTTGYAYGFDVDEFALNFKERHSIPLFISEGLPLSDNAVRLAFGGAKGGISGNKANRHQEWLSRIE